MAEAVAARPSWRPERRGDPETRRLGLIAAALGAGLALAFGAWSLGHRTTRGVPVVEAASGPVRVKPENPGGMQVTGGEETAPGPAGERLAPPPEAPEIAVLRAKLRAAQKALARAHEAEVAQAAAPRIAAPAPVQRAAAFAKPPAAAIPPILAPQRPPEHAAFAVQLGAYESEAAARAAWRALGAAVAGMAGETPVLLPAEIAGRRVWRLRAGGFAEARQAALVCAKVRQAGSDCAVAAL